MEPLHQALQRAISDVFERMFFLFPEEAAAESAPAEARCCSVRLEGEPVYDVALCLGEPLARLLAANYLGMDEPGVNAEMVDETVKEAVNVLAGALLNELGSGHRLGIPAFRERSPLGDVQRLHFRAEEQLFAVLISAGK